MRYSGMDGYLLIDKPEGISSFGVVAKVRRILSEAQAVALNSSHLDAAQGSSEERVKSRNTTLDERQSVADDAMRQKPASVAGSAGKQGKEVRRVKVGDCGTLDPAATGLMILVVGKYTKKAQEFTKMDKTYEAEITLGQTSTTADKEGELSKVSDQRPDMAESQEVLNTFIGQIEQTPPAFSAVKVDGKRAYKLAREGKEVKIEPRKVTVYKIEDVKYDYPRLQFNVSVSSGTYIRSLAEDIGKKLSTGAYLSNLRRVSIDKYQLEDAQNLDSIDRAEQLHILTK